MKEVLIREDSLPYGNYCRKNKLMERYKDSIHIAEVNGLHDIVTFREKTSHILWSHYKDTQREDDEEAQKRAIIELAARHIRSDIKTNVPSITDHYPKSEGTGIPSRDTAKHVEVSVCGEKHAKQRSQYWTSHSTSRKTVGCLCSISDWSSSAGASSVSVKISRGHSSS